MWLYPSQRDPSNLLVCISLAARISTPPRVPHTSRAPEDMRRGDHDIVITPPSSHWPGTWWCPGGGSGCPPSLCWPSSCCTGGRRPAGPRPVCRSEAGWCPGCLWRRQIWPRWNLRWVGRPWGLTCHGTPPWPRSRVSSHLEMEAIVTVLTSVLQYRPRTRNCLMHPRSCNTEVVNARLLWFKGCGAEMQQRSPVLGPGADNECRSQLAARLFQSLCHALCPVSSWWNMKAFCRASVEKEIICSSLMWQFDILKRQCERQTRPQRSFRLTQPRSAQSFYRGQRECWNHQSLWDQISRPQWLSKLINNGRTKKLGKKVCSL